MDEDDEEFAYSAGELDEEEDVDWEDVQTSQPASDPPTSQPEAPNSPPETHETASTADDPVADDAPDTFESAPNLQQIDWEQVNRSLAEQDVASVARKRRRPPIRLTKDEKQREMALHQTHLLVLLAARIKWSELSRSQLLRGLLLSLTASSDVDFFAEMKQQPLSYSLELLVRWFNREFQEADEVQAEASEADLMTESSLMDVFFTREGRDYELVMLFAALCGALQLRYRLTCALDPLLVQKGKAFESSFKQRPSKRRRTRKVADSLLKKKTWSDGGDEEEKQEVEEELEGAATADRVFWLWCEVLDEKTKSWVHVDVVRRLVGRPQEVELLRGKAARFSYVVSIQDDELLVDVTSRYTMQWSKSIELRLADSWLKQVIERFNEDAMERRGVSAEKASASLLKPEDLEKALEDEKKSLETLKLAEGMPTSVEGFRKHHLYCLERHLGQLECLHPRKVVGLFNGQPVFLREHVQPLQSAFKWRRLGRVVKESEREKPAKWQSRGSDAGSIQAGASDASDNGDGKPGGVSLALFGLWQTTSFEPPPLVDGRVPKNQYGNIEIWSPAHVPRGAVHLRLPRIDAIAEALGIDFAPAVVGFEVCNGRTMPKVAGIVVAQSCEAALLDAHAERQQQTIEKAIQHNRKLVLKRWEKLTKRLLLRQRLDDDYGAV
ncbi:DNA repair protein [Phytophthora cinnamomi]|uniref:DNA repair protein n=1 Tax=Phytophthora cinnamomi TaxID=4785 RepID=UPI00355AB10E|nr:DNA repair protein [Phytophthora cinnamomi]